MMREYARCVGDKDGVGEVFDITAKLSNSTNQEEVSAAVGLATTVRTLYGLLKDTFSGRLVGALVSPSSI